MIGRNNVIGPKHLRIFRVDHVMGLHRLYWVPKGLGAKNGAYVRYNSEAMYAVFNLESHKHKALIIGEDLVFTGGELITQPQHRAKTDKSLKGYKKALKESPIEAELKADEIIRNTYRTLMTRGMKGCYVYFTNEKTAKYFRSLIPNS